MRCPTCGEQWFDAEEEESVESCDRCATDYLVQIEVRAAELAAFARDGRLNAFKRDEFDWFVHGDEPPHSASRVPATGEEWAGWLAEQIDNHARNYPVCVCGHDEDHHFDGNAHVIAYSCKECSCLMFDTNGDMK